MQLLCVGDDLEIVRQYRGNTRLTYPLYGIPRIVDCRWENELGCQSIVNVYDCDSYLVTYTATPGSFAMEATKYPSPWLMISKAISILEKFTCTSMKIYVHRKRTIPFRSIHSNLDLARRSRHRYIKLILLMNFRSCSSLACSIPRESDITSLSMWDM